MSHDTSNYLSTENVVDRGFDAPFNLERIQALCQLFTADASLQQFVYETHLLDDKRDLKRGEFYPEILRATKGLKEALAGILQIDPIQVQPNFGSNGSIDTIMAAVKVEETEQRAAQIKALLDRLRPIANVSSGKALTDDSESPITLAEIGSLLHRLQESITTQGGALFTSPTYFRNYNSAKAKQLTIHLVPLREDYTLDTQHFIEAMQKHQPSVVFLVTPNNPTGIPIPDSDLCAILDALPASTWAVIDRTLVNIDPQILTGDLLSRYADRNVIVLHSFSKYKGMSHLRIGVALYSNPKLARIVQPHLPLGLGLEGCAKAQKIILEDGGIQPSAEIIHNIRTCRERLDRFVRDCPDFAITPFSGNYCLLTLPEWLPSRAAAELLESHGIFAMGGHEFPEPNSGVIRVHTGGPIEYISQMCDLLLAETRKRNR